MPCCMIWYCLIHGTHCQTIQRDMAVPPLHWSCHESVVVTLRPQNLLRHLLSDFPDWFRYNVTSHRPIHGTHCPTIQRDTAVPPLHRSCHGMRICRRHATAPKSAASSFVRLSRLISVQRDESEWVSSMGHVYQTFVNYVKQCASRILPLLCI
jgi:hypothetical protein